MRDFEGPLGFRNDSFSIDFTTPRAHGTRPTASRGQRVITRLPQDSHEEARRSVSAASVHARMHNTDADAAHASGAPTCGSSDGIAR
jgi:hypothetical protein